MQIVLSKKDIARLKKKWIKKSTNCIKNLSDYELNEAANGNRNFEFNFGINKETSF
jgi:hypothetical protein